MDSGNITSYSLAEDFDAKQLDDILSKHKGKRLSRDALEVHINGIEFYIFTYGVVVVWSEGPFSADFDWVAKAYIRPEKLIETDSFEYATGDTFNIHHDVITLDSHKEQLKLAISHAVAQSCKLATLENRAKKLVGTTQELASDLARSGRISLSRKKLASLQGQIHLSKSDILLRFDLLDVPDFFWEYPEYQDYYQRVYNYLEIKQRLDVIQQKSNTVDDVLRLITEELRHRHSSTLEWIIIILIAFEIAVFITHDLLRWV